MFALLEQSLDSLVAKICSKAEKSESNSYGSIGKIPDLGARASGSQRGEHGKKERRTERHME